MKLTFTFLLAAGALLVAVNARPKRAVDDDGENVLPPMGCGGGGDEYPTTLAPLEPPTEEPQFEETTTEEPDEFYTPAFPVVPVFPPWPHVPTSTPADWWEVYPDNAMQLRKKRSPVYVPPQNGPQVGGGAGQGPNGGGGFGGGVGGCPPPPPNGGNGRFQPYPGGQGPYYPGGQGGEQYPGGQGGQPQYPPAVYPPFGGPGAGSGGPNDVAGQF